MTIDQAIPPLRELPTGHLDARKRHLVAEIVRSHKRPRFPSVHWLVGTRRRVAVLAIVAAVIVIGTAVAATTSWLTGSPAPQSVVSDFGSYAPQLGFNPEPGQAVMVAADGDIKLYATTNKQGTYCLVVSAPWKRPEKLPDGGLCIPPSQARAPFIAGPVGASGNGNQSTYLIAGRTDDREARAVRFVDPKGNPITIAIGSSGFFIAAVRMVGSACAKGDWNSTFSVLGASGNERMRTTIRLAYSNSPRVCVLTAPHP